MHTEQRKKQIEQQIKLSGNMRNAAWVIGQYKKGRIGIVGRNTEEVSELVFNHFKTAIRIVNEIYENNWDIEFNVTYLRKKVFIEITGIYILFPEVIITNRNSERRNGIRHTIKDLLVRIRFSNVENRFLRVTGLDGGRLTLSYPEFQSSYFHSHLPTSSAEISSRTKIPLLQSFCTGSGEINIYQSEINGDGFSEERFMKYAMQIMSLVNYESIEGTPYRYIERISATPSSGRLFSDPGPGLQRRFFRRVIDYYKRNKKVPEVDIKIDPQGNYSIADNERFKDFYTNTEPEETDYQQFYCSAGENNQYYAWGFTPGFMSPPQNNNTFIFRGEERKFTVEAAPENDNDVEYKIHPKLIKYLKEEINYELNKNKVRNYTIERYTVKPDNATKSVSSDPIPVSTDI